MAMILQLPFFLNISFIKYVILVVVIDNLVKKIF